MAMIDKVTKLIGLAKGKFGTLSEAEKRLFEAAAKGEPADFSADSEEDNDPAGAENWGDERTLKADRIAWLCTDLKAAALVAPLGISAKGVRLVGKLELIFARISFPLCFEKCAFSGTIDLLGARIRGLYLYGSYTGSIRADGLRAEDSIHLRNGFNAKGEVRILGAVISGNLNCSNGQFCNPGGISIAADGLRVEGGIFLSDNFRAEGEVRLISAIIGGNLDCSKGQFINNKNYAINADGMKVTGYVSLGNGFLANGIVSLTGTKIGGNFECDDGKFINPGGYALSADALKVEGFVFFRKGFRAEGQVRLMGATIGGNLECDKGEFINPSGSAMRGERLKVEGSVVFCKKFRAEGYVSLGSVTIGGFLVWRDIASSQGMMLDLRSTRVGTLWDDQKSWPEKGRLFLHGLVYDEIHDEAPTSAKTRIEWLKLQPNKPFRPQPYEQLAAVLRKSGHDADARTILFTKAKDRSKFAQLKVYQKLWHHLLGLTIGYGYCPWKALRIALVVIALGWGLFAIGNKAEVITPTKVATYEAAGQGEDRRVSEDYPRFCSLVYSLDVFVPLVNLHQVTFWLPNANLKGEWRISEESTLPVSGRVLRIYLWFQIIAGWALSTLLAVGLSGLVKR